MDSTKKNSFKEKYRQTNAKHWCQYCKIFIMPTDIAKKRHEASSQHQDAVKRFVGKIQKEEKEKFKLLQEYSQKSGYDILNDTKKKEAPSAAASFYNKPSAAQDSKALKPVPVLSVRPLIPSIPRSLAVKKVVGAAPVTEKSVEDISHVDQCQDREKLMAQAAVVGHWEAVEEIKAKQVEKIFEPEARKPATVKEMVKEEFQVTEKIIPIVDNVDDSTLVGFAKRAPSTNGSRRNIRKP